MTKAHLFCLRIPITEYASRINKKMNFENQIIYIFKISNQKRSGPLIKKNQSSEFDKT